MAQTSVSNSSLFDQARSQSHFNPGNDKYTALPPAEFLSPHDLIKDCLEHMFQHEIPIEHVVDDGEIHRFSIDSNKRKRDEWYVARSWVFKNKPYLVCYYGSWRTDEKRQYKSWERIDSAGLSSEEKNECRKYLQELDKKVRRAQKIRQDNAAKEAQQIWEKSFQEPQSPGHTTYVAIKGIKPYSARFGKNPSGYDAMILPLRNERGELRSLQFISAGKDGTIYKHFLAGGETKGLFHVLGDLSKSRDCYIVEGYATGASIFEAISRPVVVTFTSSNLLRVTKAILKENPNCKVIIAGDDDVAAQGNPGRSNAEKAAKECACRVVFPKFPRGATLGDGKAPTDFNDLHASSGLDEIKRQLLVKNGYLSPINIQDFLEREIPPRELILAPWLPEQGLAMVFAIAGLGKTFLVLSIAYAIACGESFLNWTVYKPRRVLYIDGEMPASTMQERLRDISKAFTKKPPDPSFFQLVTPDFQDEGIRDLSTIEGQRDIDLLIDDIDVVIIDNLSCLVRSGNENEAESWKPVQEWILRLRRSGKTVIFVHHAGKSGKERGTSKKMDVLDTVLELRRSPDYCPSDGCDFQIHYGKSRSFGGEAATPIRATLINSPEEILQWKHSEIDGDKYGRVIELAKEGLPQRKIANEMDISVGTVNKLVQRAKAEGRLK